MPASSFSNRWWLMLEDTPRSKPSVVIATVQPLPRPPTTAPAGARASVKKTSLNPAAPSSCSMGRTSTPGCRIGTRR